MRPEQPHTRRLGDPGRERASAPPTLTCKRPHSPENRGVRRRPRDATAPSPRAPCSLKLAPAKSWQTGFKHTPASGGKNVRKRHPTSSPWGQTTENSAARRRLHDALRHYVVTSAYVSAKLEGSRVSEGLAGREFSSYQEVGFQPTAKWQNTRVIFKITAAFSMLPATSLMLKCI